MGDCCHIVSDKIRRLFNGRISFSFDMVLRTCTVYWNQAFEVGHDMRFTFYFIWKIMQNGAAPGSKSRIPPLASEPLGFGQRHDATVDIPLDNKNVMTVANSKNFYGSFFFPVRLIYPPNLSCIHRTPGKKSKN